MASFSSRWIVFAARSGSKDFWAWGLHEGGVGFSEVRLTDTDGMTLDPEGVDPGRMVLLRHLFTVEDGDAPPAVEVRDGTGQLVTTIPEARMVGPDVLVDMAIDAVGHEDVLAQVLASLDPGTADQVLTAAVDRLPAP